MSNKIKVPLDVLKGLEFVKDSGQTNMFEYHKVMKIAHDNEYYATVTWLQGNRESYSAGIFRGFEAEERAKVLMKVPRLCSGCDDCNCNFCKHTCRQCDSGECTDKEVIKCSEYVPTPEYAEYLKNQ